MRGRDKKSVNAVLTPRSRIAAGKTVHTLGEIKAVMGLVFPMRRALLMSERFAARV
jgi:hypothetical protein